MGKNGNYYDGTKLLSLKDINGNTPEIFICTSNRTGGKTTYFGRLLVNRWVNKREKFCLLYRYNYELTDLSSKFFKDLHELFFPDLTMCDERRANGKYHELFFEYTENGTKKKSSCGYALCINAADQIKKYSHMFSDVSSILFDEFQSETNNYCQNEVAKFISIHTSIARGQGKQVRYVPVYMLSNPVSIINPYYVALGISERIKTETKFLRGDGFVLEQGYVKSASDAQKSSGFNKAFESDKYMSYSTENVYLNDNLSFVETPSGQSRYICTIRYNGVDFAVREYPSAGVVYCDKKPDLSFGVRIAATTEDHDVNYVMLRRNEMYVDLMRYYFMRGCFRFKDLQCKEAILKFISY